jgi:dTDP-4-amino-4,6-dideoxygalactose transaminase
VPFNRPSIGQEEIDAVVRVLASGWLTTGPQVVELERNFASYVGAKHAIAVASATIGLQAAYWAAGVGPGDEVIVPTLTYCATASAAVALGATPVLVDVLPSGHVDPDAIRRVLSSRTRAVAPVHYAGAACDLDAIAEAAEGRSLVEDAAHAVGATYKGRRIGQAGTAVFSFYATKNMTCGEGGMVTTDSDEMAGLVRLYAGQGIDKDARHRFDVGDWEYDVIVPAVKANLSDLHAAIGVQQLAKIDDLLTRRKQIAGFYDAAFGGTKIVSIDRPPYAEGHAWHLYVIQVPGRDRFREKLLQAGIDTSVHFIPLHRMSAFATDAVFPVADELYRTMISLPLYPDMSALDIAYVADQAGNLATTSGKASGHLYG